MSGFLNNLVQNVQASVANINLGNLSPRRFLGPQGEPRGPPRAPHMPPHVQVGPG